MNPGAEKRPFLKSSGDQDAFWFLGSRATVKVGAEDTQGQLTVIEFLNPAGFAAPLHRHQFEDEMFYVLEGTARFRCDDAEFAAGPGDFVMLPVGLSHTFIVGADQPLRALQITTPSGFEHFAAAAGRPATGPGLPVGELMGSSPPDPGAITAVAARHGIEILGPPPGS